MIEDDFARHLAHEDAGTAARRRSPPTTPTGWSSTSARSPRPPRPASGWAPSPRAARCWSGCAPSRSSTASSYPRPLQEAALELVGAPAWPRHLRTVAAGLRARRDSTARGAGRASCPRCPRRTRRRGGCHLWLRLPDGTDEAALASAALRAGVAVAPGRPYFAAEPPAPHLRLSFAPVAGRRDSRKVYGGCVRPARRYCPGIVATRLAQPTP